MWNLFVMCKTLKSFCDSCYVDIRRQISHKNQTENNNAQPLWAFGHYFFFCKILLWCQNGFEISVLFQVFCLMKSAQHISTQDFSQLQFHTENQWTCRLTPAEALPVHLAQIQDASSFFSTQFESALCLHIFFWSVMEWHQTCAADREHWPWITMWRDYKGRRGLNKE